MKLDNNGQAIQEEAAVEKTFSATFDDDGLDGVEGRGLSGDHGRYGKMSRGARLLKEFKEVPMNPALEFLVQTRKNKIETDVNDDFRNMQETKASTNNPGLDLMRGSRSGTQGMGAGIVN